MSSAVQEAVPATSVGPEFFRPDMPLEQLVETKLNPREFFDDNGLDELAATIASNGVIEPLVARPAGAKYEIVCGARRFRAATRAGLKTVPVIVKPLTDAQALEMMVIENDQRKDVTALERAKGYTRLMEADPKYRDRAVLANRIGKSLSWVHGAMKLLSLIPPAQKALITGEIEEGHAILIARLEPVGQLEALKMSREQLNVLGDKKVAVPVKVLGAWIQQNLLMDLSRVPFKLDDATLVPPAGPCTTCPKRTGSDPALFADIKNGDTCTDRVCFQSKYRAATVRQLRALAPAEDGKDGGVKAVAISTAYYVEADVKKTLGVDVLSVTEWRDAGKKSCPHTRHALVVHTQSGPVGGKKTVCVNTDCSVHAPSSGGSSREPSRSEKAAATARKTLEKKRVEDAKQRRTLLIALRDRVTQLQEADLRLVAQRFVREMHADRRKQVYGLMDWPVPDKTKSQYRGAYVDFEKAAETQLANASPAVLAQFLMVASLAACVDVEKQYYGKPDTKALFETAKRWNVDAAAIAREKAAKAAAPGPARLVVSADDMEKFASAYSADRISEGKPVKALVYGGLLYTVMGSVGSGAGGTTECSAHRLYARADWPFPKIKPATYKAMVGIDPDERDGYLGMLAVYDQGRAYVLGPQVLVTRATGGTRAVQTSAPKAKSSAKKKR